MNNNVSTNVLWRANINEKKAARYFSTNGSGRDGYILNMSSKADGTSPLFKMSTSPSDKPSYTEKKFKYFSDGQGRDAYIVTNSGGLFSPRSPGDNQKAAFFSTFRQSLSPKRIPHITMITPKIIATSKRQKQMSLQLSQPKFIDQERLKSQIDLKFKLNDIHLQRNHVHSQMIQGIPSSNSFSPQFQKSFLAQNSKYLDSEAAVDTELLKLPSIHSTSQRKLNHA